LKDNKIPVNSTQLEDVETNDSKDAHLGEKTKKGQALGRLTKGR